MAGKRVPVLLVDTRHGDCDLPNAGDAAASRALHDHSAGATAGVCGPIARPDEGGVVEHTPTAAVAGVAQKAAEVAFLFGHRAHRAGGDVVVVGAEGQEDREGALLRDDRTWNRQSRVF